MSALICCSSFYLTESRLDISQFDIQFCAWDSVWGIARVITRVVEALKLSRQAD